MDRDAPGAEAAPAKSRGPLPARGGCGASYLRAKDLATLAKLPLAALVAWALPEPWWDRVAAAGLARPGNAAGEREYVESFVRGDELGVPAEDVLRGYLRNVRLVQAQYLRCHHPRGWRPTVRLEGREHLDRALAAGRGAIVWRAPFVFAPLVTMMALHGAGYEPVHLARLEHGYSPTRFGVRVLNPVRTRAEDRHLAERVVIGRVPLQEAMRTLARRLEANRVVSIAAIAQGVKTCAVPFLGGVLRVATGAPNLARRTGARLLPVFTVREGPGRFLTVVEPPLQAGPAAGRERALQDLAAQVVARTEHYARRWPDQLHWHPEILGRLRSGACTKERALGPGAHKPSPAHAAEGTPPSPGRAFPRAPALIALPAALRPSPPALNRWQNSGVRATAPPPGWPRRRSRGRSSPRSCAGSIDRPDHP